MMRPGVPTTTCAPCSRLASCGRMVAPPHRVRTFTLSSARGQAAQLLRHLVGQFARGAQHQAPARQSAAGSGWPAGPAQRRRSCRCRCLAWAIRSCRPGPAAGWRPGSASSPCSPGAAGSAARAGAAAGCRKTGGPCAASLAGSNGFVLFMSDYPGLAPTMSVLPRLHAPDPCPTTTPANAAGLRPSLPNARHASARAGPHHHRRPGPHPPGRLRAAAGGQAGRLRARRQRRLRDAPGQAGPGAAAEVGARRAAQPLDRTRADGRRAGPPDAVPAGPEVRAADAERTAALEGLGVARRAGVWTRLVRHTLPLSPPDWRVPVLFHAVLVRPRRPPSGPTTATAMKPRCARPWAHRPATRRPAEILAHLEALVERSRAFKPHHLEVPAAAPAGRMRHAAGAARVAGRLQPRAGPLGTLRRRRADKLQGLNSELAFQGYPDTFQKARRLQRR
jgi:hypothetical protein